MMVTENKLIRGNDRIDRINSLIMRLASGHLEARETPSEKFDELDAIITGINVLGEELQRSTVSRNYLKSIYDGIVDMVIILREDGTVQRVNEAVTSLLGFSEAELSGQHFSKVFVTDSDKCADFTTKLMAKKSHCNVEGKMLHKLSGSIPVSTSYSVLRDSAGEAVGHLLVAKDMTAQKQIEEEMKKSKEAAELSNRLKSSFLANMSHEIRTPLNGIIGFSEYLMGMGVTDEQKEYLMMIQNSGHTLMKLLSDILDFNKIEEGKLLLDSVPVYFKEMVTSSLQPYKYMANEKGVAFELQFKNFNNIPYVKCDPTRVNQILVNLVGNALKFTAKGKISVTLEIEKNDEKHGKATIRGTISDTGIGIPNDRMKEIFKAFIQTDSSITRRYGGSGLGLSIVKELVRMMSGDVTVSSPCLQKQMPDDCPGSDFKFFIEVEIANTPVQKRPREEACLFEEKYKLLIVEDNEMNRLLAGKVLNKLGAKVEYAQHGLEAVEKIRRNSYDAILMDVQMPVMDGLEATRAIRKMGSKTPIIGLSANVFKEDVERSKIAGMNEHIGKPFTKESLFRAIKRNLQPL